MDRRMYEVHWSLEECHWWFKGRRRILVEVLPRYLPVRLDRKPLRIAEIDLPPLRPVQAQC
jgi:hypothetical protein